MNPKKTLEILESSFAVLAITGLAVVSVFTVYSLNPKIKKEQGQVAGQTDTLVNLSSQAPLELTVNSGDFEKEVFDNKVILNIDLKNLKSAQTLEFITVSNPDYVNRKMTVSAIVPGNIEDILDVRLKDSLDEIILYSNEHRNVVRDVTFQSESERSFQLEVSSIEPINYPFNFSIEITLN